MFEGGGYWRGVETGCPNFQDGAQENVFTACWMVVEGGGIEQRYKQVSREDELTSLT